MAARKRKVERLPRKESLKGAWRFLSAHDAELKRYGTHHDAMAKLVQDYANDVKRWVGGASKRLDLIEACLRAWGPPYWSAPQRPNLDASEE